MSKQVEDFADSISIAWKGVTRNDWFQVRSWCHGAAIYSTVPEDKADLYFLASIARTIQYEVEA